MKAEFRAVNGRIWQQISNVCLSVYIKHNWLRSLVFHWFPLVTAPYLLRPYGISVHSKFLYYRGRFISWLYVAGSSSHRIFLSHCTYASNLQLTIPPWFYSKTLKLKTVIRQHWSSLGYLKNWLRSSTYCNSHSLWGYGKLLLLVHVDDNWIPKK